MLNTGKWMRFRVRVVCGIFACGCIVGLLIRLYYLQIIQGKEYSRRAVSQQLRDTVIPAPRGDILSADGTVLAASETCWTVRASPRELKDELVEPAAQALAAILEIEKEELLEKLGDRKSNDKLLKRRVDKKTADAVRDWCAENGAEGILILEDVKRIYPQGNFAGSILGFTNVDGVGVAGIEMKYNEALTGNNGRVLTAKNAWGYNMPTDYSTVLQAVKGRDLQLTIDANIQHFLENYLTAAVEEHNVSGRGVGIVMNVNTGAILAMATKPDFDPNYPRYIQDEDTRKAVEALVGEARQEALTLAQQTQWRNKAVSDLYEPGSVFKLITASAVIDSGNSTPETQYVCAGKINVAGTVFRCANGHIHGLETFRQGLGVSCNPCFIQAGARLGKEAFCDYFEAFGLRSATGVDLPAEPKKSEYYTADRMGAVKAAV